MNACQLINKERVPSPVMVKLDTAKMDQADVAKNAIAFARNVASEPVLISWFCSKEGKCGPQGVCHEDGSFWLDYAVGHGGDLSIVVNDWDYVFVFKKN